MKRPGTPTYPKTVGPQDLEPHYSHHVGAMTSEGLHEKADIAFQLALRDKRIAELEAENVRLLLATPGGQAKLREQLLAYDFGVDPLPTPHPIPDVRISRQAPVVPVVVRCPDNCEDGFFIEGDWAPWAPKTRRRCANPVHEAERLCWYVHVHECGGIWSMVRGPVTRSAADSEASDLRARGLRVDVTSDHERRGL